MWLKGIIIVIINLFFLFYFLVCLWKVKNDKCCVFLFKYKGKKYYKCIIDWVWMFWCVIILDFDKDGEWENCFLCEYL